jgi:hypothetical protein
MTPDEQRLLLMVARAVADIDEDRAAKMKTTSNLAKEIRDLVEAIRPPA